MTKEYLIRLFTFDGRPYHLLYNYRKKNCGYKRDKGLLNELIKDGVVKRLEKTNKTILFEYTGPVPGAKN